MQLACEQCRTKIFYVMLQDNGNIEVYCSTNNHKHTLVNMVDLNQKIAHELAEEILGNGQTKTDAGGTSADTRGPVKDN